MTPCPEMQEKKKQAQIPPLTFMLYCIVALRPLLSPPVRERRLPILHRITTPLLHQSPRPRSYDILHPLLLPYQHRQLRRPWLRGEEAPRIRIQPLIHDALPVPLQLGLAHCRLRIRRVRTRGHKCTVAKHIGARLPRREEYLVFEGLAGAGVDLPMRGRAGDAL